MNTAIKHMRLFSRTAAFMAVVIMLTASLAGCSHSAYIVPGDEATASPEATHAQIETLTTAPTEEPTPEATPLADDGFSRIACFGAVPEKYKGIVNPEDILFESTVSGDRIMRTEWTKDENGDINYQAFCLYDIYGEPVSTYEVPVREHYSFGQLFGTTDGGAIFVFGFTDTLLDDEGHYASDKGFSTTIVKLDHDGDQVFSAELDNIMVDEPKFMLEKNGRYYFFGDRDLRMDYHGLDTAAIVLSDTGELLLSTCFEGSKAETIWFAEECGEGFILTIYSESADGIYSGVSSPDKSFAVTVDEDLNVLKVEATDSVFEYADSKLVMGKLNGETVFRQDLIDAGFDAGTPWKIVNYGDEYLVMSLNKIGEVPCYNLSTIYKLDVEEAVYTMYSANGDIIFRQAFDYSTPEVIRLRYPELYEQIYVKPEG